MSYSKLNLKNGATFDEKVFEHLEEGIEKSYSELSYIEHQEFFNTGKITGVDSLGTIDMNGFGFIMLKKWLTKPIIGIKADLFINGKTNIPVKCEILNSAKQVIKNLSTELVINKDDTYIFDLRFSAADIDEDYCYIAIYNSDRTNGYWLGFSTIDTSSEWYTTISASGINPIYMYGKQTSWVKPSSYPKRYIGLICEETVNVDAKNLASKEYVDTRLSNVSNAYNIIQCADEYYINEGDTLEIFYKSILYAKDALSYNIRVRCNVGTNYYYKFVVPGTATAGTYPLTLQIFDDRRNLIDEKTINIIVNPRPTSPANETVVLCIGGSTVAAQVWPNELYRRVTQTSSVSGIVGSGLSNITFGGKRKTSLGGGYEGFGGWAWGNFTSTSSSSGSYWVAVASHNKKVEDQQGVYKDANGIFWQLETIEEKRLKFKKYGETSGIMPTSGTLTYVSGGVDTSNITFSSTEPEKGNPFCYNGKLDFKAYCEDTGLPKIDYVYGQMVYNDTPNNAVVPQSSLDTKVNTVKTFIEALIKDYPNAKVVLVNSPVPSYDGCATNYTANSAFQDWQYINDWMHKYRSYIYAKLKEMYPNNVEFCDVNAQFDIDHGYPVSNVAYNIRTTEKYNRQSNGVHPNDSGYYQCADAIYRHLMHMLNKYNN